MTRRGSFYLALSLAMLLQFGSTAFAQYVRVVDVATNAVIPQGATDSLGASQVFATSENAFTVTNITQTSIEVHNCSITPLSSTGTGAGWTLNGLPSPSQSSLQLLSGLNYLFTVDLISTVVGSNNARVQCFGSGSFSFNVSRFLLFPSATVGVATGGQAISSHGPAFTFPSVTVGSSKDQTFTLTNLGNTALSISSMNITGAGFSVAPPLQTNLAGGMSTTFKVTFAPASAGTPTGALSIGSNDSSQNPFVVQLQGTATAAPTGQISITDSSAGGASVAAGGSVFFGNVAAGSSVSHTFQIRNTGSGSLLLSNPSSIVSGAGYALTSAPPSSISPGSTGSFTVTFTAPGSGSPSGTVSIASNAGAPFTFGLTATVIAGGSGFTVSDLSNGGASVGAGGTVVFGSVAIGSSASHTLQLRNNGASTLVLSNPTGIVSGAGYSLTSVPPTTIAPGGTGTFTVRFVASTAGTANGTVSIASNAGPSFTFGLTATVPSGGGGGGFTVTNQGAAVANGGSILFGNTTVGSSAIVVLSLKNNSGAVLNVTQPSPLSGLNAGDFSILEDSAGGIGVNASVVLAELAFHPSAAGPESATYNVVIGGAPFTLQLSGVGVPGSPALRVAWNADGSVITNGGTYVFPSTTPNTVASQVFNVQNVGTAPLDVSAVTVTNTTGAAFSLVVTPTSPVAVGSSTPGRVRLLAATSGFFAATVSMTTSDPLSPTFTFNVRGTVQAAAPTFSVVSGEGTAIAPGASYIFPSEATGVAESRTFTVTNTGSSAMTINNADAVLASSDGSFTLIAPFPSAAIQPGATATCRIRLQAGASGPKTGTVSIDAGAAGLFTFTVTGTIL